MEKEPLLRNGFIIVAIIGIGCLIGTFLVPPALERRVLASGPITLNVNTADYVNQSYAASFTLAYGYTCNAFIANSLDTNDSEDISVYITFVSIGDYNARVENGDAPGALTDLPFMVITADYPDPSSSNCINTPQSIAEGDRYTFDFMGDGSTTGERLWSVPGTYVAVVWVTNSGFGETATFDMLITVDGQGDTIRTALTWIGLIALLAAAIIGIVYLVIKRR